jgi:HD-GYP domain-containing protein (c-di-GMP phosphodiesterase class II)
MRPISMSDVRRDGQGAGEVSLQDQGRRFLSGFYAALRALRFYPVDNEVVQQALAELQQVTSGLLEAEGVVDLQLVGNFFFLNEERLRVDLKNYSTFGSVAETLRRHHVGEIQLFRDLELREWAPFLNLLLRDSDGDDPFVGFVESLEGTPVEHIRVREEPEHEEADDESVEGARHTYTRSVQTARELLTDMRLGRAVNVRRVKRAVQGIVDQVLNDEPSMMAMTHLREFDEYTFTHSVNVCILSVIIGQRLGLGRQDLYELGLAALLHDLGKMRIPEDVLNKPGKLSDEDWRLLKEHPADGLIMLFDVHGFMNLPFRQMLVAYEHHMKVDLTGYPSSRRPRDMGLFSRIVAVADGFDAATSVRSYQYRPAAPDDVLKGMLENKARGFDPVVVKALVTATGVYPVGTLVILDTFELAVVTKANPDPARLHQPEVKLLSDPMGIPLAEPEVTRLDQIDPTTGEPRRSIIRTADPKRYGIQVADFVT